jgi:hypothetical protein
MIRMPWAKRQRREVMTHNRAEDRGACRLQGRFGFIEPRVCQVERATVGRLEAGAIGAQRRAPNHDRHVGVEPERERVVESVGSDLASGASRIREHCQKAGSLIEPGL